MRTAIRPVFATFLLTFFIDASAADKSPGYTRADLSAATALRKKAADDATAYELVRSLTTEIGPRPAGSPGDKAAVAWALREMQRLGFKNVHTVEADVPHWERGEAEFAVISPWPQTMPTLALGGSIGTGAEGIEAEAVMVRDLDALAALPPGAVKDRIVFFNQRMDRTRDGTGYGRAVRVRASGPAAAGALGAAGVVIRSISTSDDRHPHTGATRLAANSPRIPAFALSNPDADALERQFESGKPVRLRMRSSSRDLPQVRSANVIGEIPGSDLANEIVILGAHLDSWDPGVGAIDDGAGVAIAMGAGKLIGDMQQRPARTIRVVAFANEEQGLHGGRAYVAKHIADVRKHQIAAESDFGAGRIYAFSSGAPDYAQGAVKQIADVLAPLGIAYTPGEGGPGPDISPFAGFGLAWAALRQDGTDYFDYHHTPDDTLDKIDPKALAQNVAAYAVFAYLAADAKGDFGSKPGQVTPPRE